MVGSKQPQPVFLSVEEADKHCQAGASVWKFASTDDGLNPDVVLVGIGSELTFEVVVAASILRRICPALRVRVVNVTDLMILEAETMHPHSLSNEEFSSLFTADRPIHFNYHGYSNEIRGLLFGRSNLDRVTIECYKEEGSTTTPFDMMLRNNVSRYHVIEAAIKGAAKHNLQVALDMTTLLGHVRHQVSKVQEYIMASGRDPEGTFDIPKFEGTVFEGDAKKSGTSGKGEDGFFVN
jgi:xylulose-5-phosphate/fructose-6-phosphate phosphoketolase